MSLSFDAAPAMMVTVLPITRRDRGGFDNCFMWTLCGSGAAVVDVVHVSRGENVKKEQNVTVKTVISAYWRADD